MYKQPQSKSKIPNGPDSLRHLCVCNRSCGLFVEPLGGSDYCQVGFDWGQSGGGELACSGEVNQGQLSTGSDRTVRFDISYSSKGHISWRCSESCHVSVVYDAAR